MTARRIEIEVTFAGLQSGPCGWGTRLRQLDGHRNGLLGLDVHDSSGSWKTIEGTWEVTGHVSMPRAFGHARRCWGWDMRGQKGRLSYLSSDAPMYLQTNALRAQCGGGACNIVSEAFTRYLPPTIWCAQ